MIILIAGYSHTGKTLLAQKLLERLSYPYLSIDHLKMGLCRSGRTELTPESDNAELTAYLWPIINEMLKTSIENGQNMIVEGCYIPFDFAGSLPAEYLREVHYVCLIFSERYIDDHYDDIIKNENVIERRGCDNHLPLTELKIAHRNNLAMCRRYGLGYILIDGQYDIERYAEAVIYSLTSKTYHSAICSNSTLCR